MKNNGYSFYRGSRIRLGTENSRRQVKPWKNGAGIPAGGLDALNQ